MIIKILGTGCTKCKKLEENARKAIIDLSGAFSVEKVTNLSEIIEYGVMLTPALVINEVVKSVGKVCSVEEIQKYLYIDK